MNWSLVKLTVFGKLINLIDILKMSINLTYNLIEK